MYVREQNANYKFGVNILFSIVASCNVIDAMSKRKQAFTIALHIKLNLSLFKEKH